MSDAENHFQIGNLQATPEQCLIIKAALAGESFKVPAFAGASKTTTLKGVAEHLTFKRILYLAFNKAIADEARQLFPNWVECRTAHSLAYRFMMQAEPRYQQKLKRAGAFLPYQDLESYSNKPAHWHPFRRSRFQVNIAISETLNQFLNSAEIRVDAAHIPEVVMQWCVNASSSEQQSFVEQLVSFVQQLADNMLDPSCECGMTHDAYLKAFQLRKPKLSYDVILLDEAQDTNPVLQAILLQQVCQKVFVGDKHQEIYAWRNAVNTLERVALNEYALTHSFRFGEHISSTANKLLSKLNETRRIVGLAQDLPINRGFDPYQPYAVMCRTNAKVFEVADFCLQRNISYCINGGLEQITRLIESAYGLFLGDRQAPKSAELSLFNSWQEFSEVAEELNKAEWKTIVKFVETHKAETLNKIKRLASNAQNTSTTQVFISTVHKAKGLGFDQVVLASDFEWPDDAHPAYKESLNVIYVAITRAKRVLVLPKNLRKWLN
ncbi:ATP-dependent helicase [Thiomicrospira microaerophila]|uniref:3'-5' exonuclease n=1 Tax=Thiomicrospira microaerophila TaxID=406020 RepID=UPI00200C53A8|nr:3'-5' exonuclease [Thiomicrospira microaerophila]UQB43210.1 ATP-dependent helicase [Thiomicrospira microaerophila]